MLGLCDADGATFAAYRYDAWGLPQGAGDLATGVWTQATTLVNQALAGQIAARQALRYASYAYDAESGLYYCSARSHALASRQWTTGDPAKADGGRLRGSTAEDGPPLNTTHPVARPARGTPPQRMQTSGRGKTMTFTTPSTSVGVRTTARISLVNA